jgi:hypothetical protein
MPNNMKTSLKVVVSVTIILLFVAFVTWRERVGAQVRMPTTGIVVDATSSHEADRMQGCLDVLGLSERVVAEAVDHPGTQLVALSLGDSSTGGVPVMLSQHEAIPARIALSEGEDIVRKRRHTYLVDLYNNCMHAPAPEYSAIYLSIERMLETLRTHGCKPGVGCALWVDTDGDENVQMALQKRLRGEPPSHEAAVAPLDNIGIEVHFCGLAETSTGGANRGTKNSARSIFRTHRDPRHVAEVWRSIFTDPTTVFFTPFCAQPANRRDYVQDEVATAGR